MYVSYSLHNVPHIQRTEEVVKTFHLLYISEFTGYKIEHLLPTWLVKCVYTCILTC